MKKLVLDEIEKMLFVNKYFAINTKRGFKENWQKTLNTQKIFNIWVKKLLTC